MVLFNSLFPTDLEAGIYIGIIFLIVIFINWLISFVLERIQKLSAKIRITSIFILKIISVIFLIFLIFSGFPIMDQIDPTYKAILSTSVSTAIAFASSGIFSNLISGIALIIIHSFEIGDIIKIRNNVGIIRKINLTKLTIETFDNIIIEKSNTEILTSSIINYSLKYEKVKKFDEFKKKLQNIEIESSQNQENIFHDLYQSIIKKKKSKKIHNFIFTMQYNYKEFHKKLEETDKLIEKYQDIFGIKPVYHIFDFGMRITVRFRILTENPEIIMKYQPEFAKELYQIIGKL